MNKYTEFQPMLEARHVECTMCGKDVVLRAPRKAWEEYASPNRRLIQEVFPDMSAGEREMLISGICSDCFDSIFG